MSIRGPQALASLEDAMRDIRREEDDVSKRVARAAERLSKTREHEADLFRQLARLRLEPSVQEDLEGHISSAEAKARDMLKAHARDVNKAGKALSALDTQRAELAERRAAALALLAKQQADFETLAKAAIDRLASDADFVAQRAETEELDRIAEQSRRKTEMAEADREAKGQPYRDDPLFMYLWEAGYGTSAYKANNLIRYFDSLVADRVGFAKARANFAMLNEIPLRLREHADLQEAKVTAAEAQLAALETAAVDAAGGLPLRQAIAGIQTEIDTLDTKIAAIEDQRDAAARDMQTLAEGRGPAFEGATADLAAALGREDIKVLLAEARKTQTGQDDTIVAQIDEARSRMREEQEESRELQDRLKTLAQRRRELEDIQWEFKKQRFDDPGSSFKEENLVGDLLNDFLRGGISAASYWDQWRKSQNWAPGSEWGAGYKPTRQSSSNSPWPPSGGGFQRPDSSIGGSSGGKRKPSSGGFGGGWGSGSSSGGSSGGFSRPRTGSSGTRKHGGFKTGGGF